jgi:HK97 family phage major capsid protein
MAEITTEKLETMLTSFRNDVTKAIDERAKLESDQANKEIVELKSKLTEANTAIKTLEESAKKTFGLPGCEREAKKFSWANYFKGLSLNHQAAKGIISPSEAAKHWDGAGALEASLCKEYSARVQKDATATDGSSGGFLVPPEVYQGDVIDTVYANTAVLKMPCMKLTGLRTDVPIPVDNGNLTAYSVGENEKPTKTDPSFKLAWLRPKKIGVFCKISNRLLYQTNEAIATIIRNKMGMDGAVKLSQMLTNGSGSDSEGRGILKFYDSMTGTKNVGANGARFTIDDLASMKQSLAAANELRDTPTYGAIMRPEVEWGMLRQKVQQYSGQGAKNGALLLPSVILDKMSITDPLKLAMESTTQIPATDVVGTSATSSKVVLGDWSKFVYASFRDPVFRVSTEAGDGSTGSALLDDEVYMVMFMEYDCTCLRPAAFTGRGGAETAEASW